MPDGKAAVDCRIDEKLAIDGGNPVRTEPLPPEFPGANHYGEKEEEYVLRVVKAKNPFRFLDYGIDSRRIFCCGTMKNGAIPSPRIIYNDHLTVGFEPATFGL
jgi:hypothetical protein